jgi:hypothetical protein
VAHVLLHWYWESTVLIGTHWHFLLETEQWRKQHYSKHIFLKFLTCNYVFLTYLLTYSMVQSSSWEANWLQLVKKIPAFYGTRRFITALTSLRQPSLSWANPIQSTYPHPTPWRSILILSTHVPDLTWFNFTDGTSLLLHTQSDSGGKVDIFLCDSIGHCQKKTVHMNLRLIQDEERPIFFDVIILVIIGKKVNMNLCLIPDEERSIFFMYSIGHCQKKKVHMNLYLIPDGYQNRAVWIYEYKSTANGNKKGEITES